MHQQIKDGIDKILEQHELKPTVEIEIKELHVLAQKNSLDNLPLDREPTAEDFQDIKYTVGKRGDCHFEVHYDERKIGDITFGVDPTAPDTNYDLAKAVSNLVIITEEMNRQGYNLKYNPNEISYRQEVLSMAAFHVHGRFPLTGKTAKTLYDCVMKGKAEMKAAAAKGRLEEYLDKQKEKFLSHFEDEPSN